MRRESYLSQPQAVEIYKVSSGTDVIMRRNITKTEREENQEGEKHTSIVWECEETQFRYKGELTAEEIESDFDYWFEHGADTVDQTELEGLTLEEARTKKYQEIAAACEEIIFAGTDVEISTGVEHFSLTERDQLNLIGKKIQIFTGEEELEYHEDGQPCRYFTPEDMQKVIEAAMAYVSWNTTYCNALNMWIKATTKPSELEEIYWGVEVPEKYQSEVLKDYIKRKEETK